METLLDEIYSSRERVTRDEIYRRAVAQGLPADVVNALDGLPEGEYAQDEVVESVGQITGVPDDPEAGVPAGELAEDDLMRELAALHRTRHETLRHASEDALERHSARTAALEAEYLSRHPAREVDPQRLRAGARSRRESTDPDARTGAEQPWDPEDLAAAQGRDATPPNLTRAARELSEQGAAAIEKTVP